MPGRFRASSAILGVGLVYLLVLSLSSAFNNANQTFVSYIVRPNNDLWVTPKGSDNLIRASGSIPLAMEHHLEAIDGVAAAFPVARAFITLRPQPTEDPSQRDLLFVAFGFRSPNGLGGPPRFFSGIPPKGANEMAIDRAAAHRLNVGVGDSIWFADREFRVSGITDGTNLIVTQMVFFDLESTEFARLVFGGASFFIVELTPDADAGAVRREIETLFPNVWVSGKEEFSASNRREAAAGYIELLSMLYVLGFGVSFVVVGLIISGLIGERRTDLAVMMALGTRERLIWLALCWIGFRLAIQGALVGVILAFCATYLLDQLYPVIPLDFGVLEPLYIGGFFGFSGILAAVFPVLRLRDIDPFEAFRP